LKKEITKILFEKGYILNYKFVEDGPQGTIKVALKYDSVNKVNAIKKLERISSPGMRKYTGYKDMPRVINGFGVVGRVGCNLTGPAACRRYCVDVTFIGECDGGSIRRNGTITHP
jgi:small subunit ribosomal protein S8